MDKQSPMSNEEYRQNGGVKCPYCRSENVMTAGNMEADSGIAWQPVKCCNCDAEWTDQYNLTGYAPVE